MVKFNVIAFTHSGIGLEQLGNFHVDTEEVKPKMESLKSELDLHEIMYLSTCNRVEFVFVTEKKVDKIFIARLVSCFNPLWDLEKITSITKKARQWQGINAVNHLIEVASSLDSMVLGEREIITQVRNAYEFSRKENLSGDMIRIAIRQTIETAKKVYTETSIAEKSVSVVSLAYQELRKSNLPKNTKILVVGSGVTNQNMLKFLQKDGYTNFTIFNRTLKNAEKLAKLVDGNALPLKDLSNFQEGFDLILTCTGATNPVITQEIYHTILKNTKQKHIVDLAIPNDVTENVYKAFPINYISVNSLKKISEQNLLQRKRELLKARQIIFDALEEFKSIFKMRQIELKMQAIPKHVKEIRAKAENEIFTKELNELDQESKAVLNKILNYMEKKYISVPMIIAKEMLTKNKNNAH